MAHKVFVPNTYCYSSKQTNSKNIHYRRNKRPMDDNVHSWVSDKASRKYCPQVIDLIMVCKQSCLLTLYMQLTENTFTRTKHCWESIKFKKKLFLHCQANTSNELKVNKSICFNDNSSTFIAGCLFLQAVDMRAYQCEPVNHVKLESITHVCHTACTRP